MVGKKRSKQTIVSHKKNRLGRKGKRISVEAQFHWATSVCSDAGIVLHHCSEEDTDPEGKVPTLIYFNELQVVTKRMRSSIREAWKSFL